MKIAAFGCLKEEMPYFEQMRQKENVDIVTIPEILNDENLQMAAGCDAISVLATSHVTADRMKTLKSLGIKYVGARCVGYNHIDIDSAKEQGIRVCNAVYSQHCVADFTMMLMLMCVRKAGFILDKNKSYDYSLYGECGSEMPDMTVGIIGTGRIGAAVAQRVRGFGSKIIAFDLYKNPDLEDFVEYVSLEELFARADIITLHCTLNEHTYHLLNHDTLNKCKDSVILINAARGELIDTSALIDALDSGKIGGAGIDCFEDEYGIIQADVNYDIRKRHDIILLQNYPNVIFTPHVAFYTKQAIRDLVVQGVNNLLQFETMAENPAEIKK